MAEIKKSVLRRRERLFVSLVATAGCSSSGHPPSSGAADATADVVQDAPDASAAMPDVTYAETSSEASTADPCSLPGSIRFTSQGVVVMSGGQPPADLSFLRLPVGFCAHYFATVGNARQLRFAPGGELFVASPTSATTSGGPNGQSAIVVLPDDDQDGTAEAPIVFLSGLPSTQGLLFANQALYYQDGTKIMRVPYSAGDRTPSGQATVVADIKTYVSGLHWPKTLDIADDGTIYVGNGGDQGETCDPARPFHGGILRLDGTPGGTPVAKGLRNPIAVRCVRGKKTCFVLELGMDYSWAQAGHEKLFPIRDGDDWGFPCCATRDAPFQGVAANVCAGVTRDTDSFVIGDTPFGLDFEPGNWPAPWGGSAFIAMHGAFGSWAGARIVSVSMDRTSGLMLSCTDVNGGSMTAQDQGAMNDFATGWDDGTHAHGRPTALTLSSDGRLFVADDQKGVIFWIAPIMP